MSLTDPTQAITEQGTALEGQAKGMLEKEKGFMDKIKSLGIPAAAIIVLGILAQLQFPFWSIAVVAFYVGIFQARSWGTSFAYGTAAVTLLWTTYAGFLDSANGGAMSGAISNLFGGAVKGTQLMYVTGLIGGVLGGLSAATGTAFRFMFNEFRSK